MPHPRIAALLGVLLLTACGHATAPDSDQPAAAPPDASSAAPGPVAPVEAPPEPGFAFALRPAAATSPEPPASSRVAPSEPLPAAETAALFARLPAIAAAAADVQAAALRPASRPPPRTGETVATPFPPPPRPASAPPSEVPSAPGLLRWQPEGDVPFAPRVTLTFATPMVALTSHEALARDVLPASITPAIEGAWRWVGAKTLLFDPVGRAPMATRFSVTLAPGLKDALGRPLPPAAPFTFETPPPRVLSAEPSGEGVTTDPVFRLVFDQRVDLAAALPRLVVSLGGEGLLGALAARQVSVRPLTPAELEAERQARHPHSEETDAGRVLRFKPASPLPTDARVSVVVPPGFPSAEGPRLTTEAQRFGFRTHGAFKVRHTRCGWSRDCKPGMPFLVELTNPIDPDRFDPSIVRVDPLLPGLSVDVSGDRLLVRGRSTGRTRYTVTVAPGLFDVHGQALGAAGPFTFEVGPSTPELRGPPHPLTTLEPGPARRALTVHLRNVPALEVRLHKVTPADWGAWQRWLARRWSGDAPPPPPGREVLVKTLRPEAPPEALHPLDLDLSPALDGDLGHVIMVVSAPSEDRWERQRLSVATWVQSTRLGLDAFWDGEALVAWSTRLADGTAAAGVDLALLPGAQEGAQEKPVKSDARGLARLPLPAAGDRHALLVATDGADTAILPNGSAEWDHDRVWQRRPGVDALRWLTFDDRRLYRPGETLSLKGALRLVEKGPRGDLGLLPAGALTRVRWRAFDSARNELGAGETPVSALGTFHLQLTLPATPSLGSARLELSTDAKVEGAARTHWFEIQEFRRPDFEVSAQASEGPHLVGGSATVSLRAGYFAGGPLAGAPVSWTARATPASFSPPNAGDFTFGRWVPWWRHDPSDSWAVPPQTLAGQTDASGMHVLGLDFLRVHPPRPALVSAEATVVDVNRQTWSTTATLLVHPSEALVGLRAASLFIEAGAPIAVDAVATDLSGVRLAGRPLTLRFARLDWRRERGRFVEVEVDPETCTVTSAAEPVTCRHVPRAGGRHRVIGRVVDAAGRAHESELSVWVPGGERPPDQDLAQEQVTLVPTRRAWEPGETAEILVQAPFSPATGLALIVRGDLAETIPLDLPNGSATLRLPVADWMVPGVVVRVQVNGSRPRAPAPGESASTTATRPPRQPAFASGVIGLDVATTTRRLTVTATPAAERLEPGAATSVTVAVRDHADKPVAGAEVAVLVVDEAVLALSGHQHPDPVLAFYLARGGRLSAAHSRDAVLLATEPADGTDAVHEREGAMTGGAPATKAARAPSSPARRAELKSAAAEPSPEEEDAFARPDGGATGPAAIGVRADFNPLAVFAPAVTTDAEGRASVPVTLPDNLTRYRVVAVALAGPRLFGKGEAAITARLPLMVRVTAPRFLNYGDRFELPVTVQNQTDAPLPVALVVRAANATVEGPPGRAVTVPPNDRVEVRVPVAAASAGTARLQVGATSGRFSDAAEVSLPVWTPATTEAFATYGELDGAAIRQPVRAPDGVLPGFGGLDVETSSTQLQALTDAVVQLATYPYGCAEQLASRMMSLAALKDVLAAFQAPGLPSPEALAASVSTDLARLATLQGRDGGFAFWRRDGETWPFLTAHVAHALVRVRAAGYAVPGLVLERALGYLKDIRKHLPEDRYGPEVARGLEAFALYVRHRAAGGQADVAARAQALLAEDGGPERANLELVGWLYPILSALNEPSVIAPVRRALLNRVSETAGAAHFTTSWQDAAWLILHSDRRVDALLLEGLIADQPDSDLIPKLVRGLLAHRTRGAWQSTQESSWVLLALNHYFRTYEKTPPSFVARAWLGDRFAGEHAFRGRTTERHAVHVPMAELVAASPADLTLGKAGAGRLYYRVGLRYAPASLTQAPADHGFHVERSYEAVDDPADVVRDADGRWVFRAGARVRVKVLMHNEDRRYHVALVDPLPAGLEPLNPELLGTQSAPPAAPGARDDAPGPRGHRGWRSWHGPWYAHDNLRDERAEAFASFLPAGVHRYTYLARATTPGHYVAPAPKAEEMYAPETFGRGASDRVLVR